MKGKIWLRAFGVRSSKSIALTVVSRVLWCVMGISYCYYCPSPLLQVTYVGEHMDGGDVLVYAFYTQRVKDEPSSYLPATHSAPRITARRNLESRHVLSE